MAVRLIVKLRLSGTGGPATWRLSVDVRCGIADCGFQNGSIRHTLRGCIASPGGGRLKSLNASGAVSVGCPRSLEARPTAFRRLESGAKLARCTDAVVHVTIGLPNSCWAERVDSVDREERLIEYRHTVLVSEAKDLEAMKP